MLFTLAEFTAVVLVGNELLSPITTPPERFDSVTRMLLPNTIVLFAVTLLFAPITCVFKPA